MNTMTTQADAPDTESKPQGEPLRDLSIGLVTAPWSAAGWAVFCIVPGALLFLGLGTVARWVGIGLMLIGAIFAISALRWLLSPAGNIAITGTGNDATISLPRGRASSSAVTVPMAKVTSAYFLRHALPMNSTSPMLVIEADGNAYQYPRHWFTNEAEQRQLIHAILARISNR